MMNIFEFKYNGVKVFISIDITKIKEIMSESLKYSIKEEKEVFTKNIDFYSLEVGVRSDVKFKKYKDGYIVKYNEVYTPYLYYILNNLINLGYNSSKITILLRELYLMDLTKEADKDIRECYLKCLDSIIVNNEYSLLELRNNGFTLSRKN